MTPLATAPRQWELGGVYYQQVKNPQGGRPCQAPRCCISPQSVPAARHSYANSAKLYGGHRHCTSAIREQFFLTAQHTGRRERQPQEQLLEHVWALRTQDMRLCMSVQCCRVSTVTRY